MDEEHRPQPKEEAGTSRPQPPLSPGEQERFNRTVLPYLDAAYNLARHLMRDAHAAEDAVQEAFVRALRHFGGLRGVDGRAWLLSIVRNVCFTHLRRQRSRGERVEFDEELHGVDETAPGPAEDLDRALAAESVRDGLERLAIEYREVLVLRELEDMSYKEIAQVTGVPIGTVMSRLSRGRRQLMLTLNAAAKGGD